MGISDRPVACSRWGARFLSLLGLLTTLSDSSHTVWAAKSSAASEERLTCEEAKQASGLTVLTVINKQYHKFENGKKSAENKKNEEIAAIVQNQKKLETLVEQWAMALPGESSPVPLLNFVSDDEGGSRLDHAAINQLARSQVRLLYYSGHGARIAGQDYLIPVDIDVLNSQQIRDRGVKVETILSYFADITPRCPGANALLNVIIIDACRNDPAQSTPTQPPPINQSELRAEISHLPPNTILLYATTAGGVVTNPATNSSTLLTEILTEKLRGEKALITPIDALLESVRYGVRWHKRNLSEKEVRLEPVWLRAWPHGRVLCLKGADCAIEGPPPMQRVRPRLNTGLWIVGSGLITGALAGALLGWHRSIAADVNGRGAGPYPPGMIRDEMTRAENLSYAAFGLGIGASLLGGLGASLVIAHHASLERATSTHVPAPPQNGSGGLQSAGGL